MKRTTTLLAAFLCLTIAIQAQQKQPKFLAELSLGPSLPVGRFAATSVNSEKKVPGFAKPGLGVQFSAGYYLNKSFGLLVTGGYAVHSQDDQTRIESFKNAGVTTIHLDSENWKEIKVMAGGFYVIPLTPASKWRLFTKLTAGVCKTAVPKINYTGYTTDSRIPVNLENGKTSMPWTFAYQASAGLQYNLSQKWYVGVDASYFNAAPVQKYNFTAYTLSPGSTVPTGQPVSGKNSYSLAAINALVSVGINF
jgi:opacity protein-like surface antigen